MIKPFLFLPLFFLVSALVQAQTPKEILVKSDLRRGLEGSFYVRVKTVSVDGADKQIHEYDVKVLNPDVSLVEQMEPIRARGRKLLMRGLDMWLFTPDVKKPVRISLQQKFTGEIQNGDISRTNYAQDYKAEIDSSSKDPQYYVLNLEAVDPKVTYEKIRYWVEKKSFRPAKAEFYASSGKLLKTAKFLAYKKIGKYERMTRVVIEDSLNKKLKSEIFYSRHAVKKFDESLFNKEQMMR